jgi:DNA-binding IclR family transcriptional regulator
MGMFRSPSRCSVERNDLLDALDLPQAAGSSDLESVDLILRLLELLARSPEPRGVSDVARQLGISKPRAHRHLRALVQRGYACQDAPSDGYEVGVKVLTLGEAVRDRFDAVRAIRPQMAPLREATGLAVTATTLIEGAVTVVEMMQGRTLIEFAVRPGARLDFHASAHGLIALAFGPPSLLERALSAPLKTWTDRTVTDPAAVRESVALVRRQGWATAVDAVQVGVNALAAPVFDHRGDWQGTIALVGATQFIPERPSDAQIALVKQAAAAASRTLGWRPEQG